MDTFEKIVFGALGVAVAALVVKEIVTNYVSGFGESLRAQLFGYSAIERDVNGNGKRELFVDRPKGRCYLVIDGIEAREYLVKFGGKAFSVGGRDCVTSIGGLSADGYVNAHK